MMQVTRPQPSSRDGGGLSAGREQLGLPRIGTARPFALAMIIDAVGSGLFLPFSLLYFHHAGGLSLTEAGLGLTIAMLIAVPAPLPVAPMSSGRRLTGLVSEAG